MALKSPVKNVVRWFSNFDRILKLLLFFPTDSEEWRYSGAVAHRLTLLLQCVYYGASPGAQCIEYSILKRHHDTSCFKLFIHSYLILKRD